MAFAAKVHVVQAFPSKFRTTVHSFQLHQEPQRSSTLQPLRVTKYVAQQFKCVCLGVGKTQPYCTSSAALPLCHVSFRKASHAFHARRLQQPLGTQMMQEPRYVKHAHEGPTAKVLSTLPARGRISMDGGKPFGAVKTHARAPADDEFKRN